MLLSFSLISVILTMSSSPETSSTAQILKTQTASNHAALEALLLPYLQACTDAEAYAGILRSFYGFFAPLEVLIQQQVDHLIITDMNHRRKAARILDDLRFLGCPDTPPICAALPSVANLFEALGAMYVLEGSTLGGRGITKMLLRSNPSWAEATHFFGGYGADTGGKWMQFITTINQYTTQQEVEAMVAAANDCFLKFRYWLEHRAETGAMKFC